MVFCLGLQSQIRNSSQEASLTFYQKVVYCPYNYYAIIVLGDTSDQQVSI